MIQHHFPFHRTAYRHHLQRISWRVSFACTPDACRAVEPNIETPVGRRGYDDRDRHRQWHTQPSLNIATDYTIFVQLTSALRESGIPTRNLRAITEQLCYHAKVKETQ